LGPNCAKGGHERAVLAARPKLLPVLTSPMTTASIERPRVEVLWRYDSLRKAGFDERDALELAMRVDVDLHLALRLISSGCDHETALRILR
jgi:hypothetical protein